VSAHAASVREAALRWRAAAAPAEATERAEWADSARRAVEGWARRRAFVRARLLREARRVRAGAETLRGLPDAELDARLARARERVRLGREAKTERRDRWALLVEAADRALGERPYAVQIAGAIALERGAAVEMATGEGKTLVTGLAAAAAGWRGRGCHAVTVNDYLAARDRDWMAPLHERCGVRTASVTQESTPDQRRDAYSADVTYLTCKEAAADFLRDALALGRGGSLAGRLLESGRPGGGAVMRGLAEAIVDEADSVLLDEAVTPLMISQETPAGAPASAVRRAAALAREMEEGRDYRLVARDRDVRLSRAGRALVERERPGDLSRRRWEECVTEALTALRLFHRGEHYIIEDGRAVIIDESTGRLTPDRSWRHGFHQVIEAKEGLDLSPVKETLARISFQRFFRLYGRLSGLSGTMRENAAELWSVYGLTAVALPPNRPCARRERPDRLYARGAERDRAAVREIASAHAMGRPVLAGVRRVADADRLSALIAEAGLEHQVLSATRHAEEAELVARAGAAGTITVATNMAGRGTDIRLDDAARAAGGLHVVALERQASRRLDRQLFGRAGRQGDPGEAVAFGSLEDEVVARFGGVAARAIGRLAPGGGRLPRGAAHLWRLAQRRASSSARWDRRAVLRHDEWLDDALALGARSPGQAPGTE